MSHRLRIFTWHIHGAYLYYLSQIPHDIFVPYKPDRSGWYTGKWGHIPWPDNLYEIPAHEVKDHSFDCVLFQRQENVLRDQFEILSEHQRQLPRIYLEHDAPNDKPTETRPRFNDPDALIVHVTAYNQLMWDYGCQNSIVIDHGVKIPDGIEYSGELPRGLTAINNLFSRGRLLGADVFTEVHKKIPLDLVGMDAKSMPGGIGEVFHKNLPDFESHYRFYFNPIRHASMPLAVVEAMMVGLPVVALATTELPTVIHNGVSGYINTNPKILIQGAQELIADKQLAHKMGQAARDYARARFGMERFKRDWNQAFEMAMQIKSTQALEVAL